MRVCGSPYVHERGVDVVGALPVDGDEEGQAAVGRKHVHAAVLLVVARQQGDAAVLHAQRGGHHVQGLAAGGGGGGGGGGWGGGKQARHKHGSSTVVDGASPWVGRRDNRQGSTCKSCSLWPGCVKACFTRCTSE